MSLWSWARFFAIVEALFLVADDLVVLVALPCDHHDVVRAHPVDRQLDRDHLLDRHGAVLDGVVD